MSHWLQADAGVKLHAEHADHTDHADHAVSATVTVCNLN